jgi:hypothetical protein
MPTKTPVWSLDRTPNHYRLQPLGFSRCFGHRDNQESHIPGVSEFVLCAKLRTTPSTHWHYVSFILPAPTGSPWFQAHWLGQLPNSLRRSNIVRPGITQWVGNRHVCWELLRRRPEGSGSIYSQVLPAWRLTASDTGRHSWWDTLVKTAAEAVADHQGPRSKSWGQSPAEVGDPPAQRVEERPVECYTQIRWTRRPFAVEDDQTGDESSYYVSTLVTQGEWFAQTLRKPK